MKARLAVSKRLGADVVIDYTRVDPLCEIMRLTGGHGVDVAIEALGTQALVALLRNSYRPSSLPLKLFGAGKQAPCGDEQRGDHGPDHEAVQSE